MSKKHLGPSCHNLCPSLNVDKIFTHIKLHIYPDGGVARFRVYGQVDVRWETRGVDNKLIDLAAVENGGLAVQCSDQHFSNMNNLLMPNRAVNMGDGWETKRRRGPGFDWVIIQLGIPGIVKEIRVDTAWFKGNFPDKCSVEFALIKGKEDPVNCVDWQEVLPRTKLEADKVHIFGEGMFYQEALNCVWSHVRLNIFPDGGISRLRVFGIPHLEDKPLQELTPYNRLQKKFRQSQKEVAKLKQEVRSLRNTVDSLLSHLKISEGDLIPHSEYK